MSNTPITTSLFELFKVGPGPSSSHTIGPMKAAFDFQSRVSELSDERLASATAIEVYLYGSLAATGKGHGTDRAVAAGLLGWTPEATDPVLFSKLMAKDSDVYLLHVKSKQVSFRAANIHFEKGRYESPHPNTLVLRLVSNQNVLLEEEYYSVGGGFISRKGETLVQTKASPKFPYSTMKELKEQMATHGLSLAELILQNETVISGHTKKEIYRRIDLILAFMHKAVRRGLRGTGVLPGSINLQRKAAHLYKQAKARSVAQDSFLIFLNAYCEAASEENAAGSIVVTAPTSGASGVIPGITFLLAEHYHYDKQKLRDGMLAAAAIGFLVKHNASISGAEMGCMGEIGTASAMGAAMIAYGAEKSIDVVEAAAEIAIEHHLGMTCDPIGGYVQIPCIERNAMGAVKAYNAYLLASSGNHAYQKISLDSVIKVMKATGEDMSKKYKETSEAGLALSATEC
jgi:L-serine dehydratase